MNWQEKLFMDNLIMLVDRGILQSDWLNKAYRKEMLGQDFDYTKPLPSWLSTTINVRI